MNQNLAGKVALVTGASRGMGREIAENLAQQGAKVVVNYSSNPDKAEKVVTGIKQKGGEAVAIRADISQVAELEQLFQTTLEAYGQLDILVNNAGIMITKPILNMTEEDFDKQFAINVKGTFFACQQAAKYMKDNGRIINFSTSVTGQMFPTYSVYAGTKGAVEQITRQVGQRIWTKRNHYQCCFTWTCEYGVIYRREISGRDCDRGEYEFLWTFRRA